MFLLYIPHCLSFLLAEGEWGISVCFSVLYVPGQASASAVSCTSACKHTQISMCPHRPDVPRQTHTTSHVYICLHSCLLCLAINIYTSLLKQAKFFFSPELPNAGSRRLAIVVTLIPRFLLQLASKQHCKFPNNWDKVLCKSPSRR